MQEINYCTHCGGKQNLNALFCSHCGIKLVKKRFGNEEYFEPRVTKVTKENYLHPLEQLGFWSVYRSKYTYLNLLYLLFLFPIGIAVFVYTVTVFSTAAGLLPIIVGFPMMYVFLLSIPYLMKGQAWMTKHMVGVPMPKKDQPKATEAKKEQSFTQKAANNLKSKGILKGFLYFLIVAMPVGIVTFTLVVTLLSVSVGFIFAWVSPFVEFLIHGSAFSTWYASTYLPVWLWIIIYCLLPFVGIFLLTLSLNLLNRLAVLHGRLINKLIS